MNIPCAKCSSPRHSTEGHDRLEKGYLEAHPGAVMARIAVANVLGHEVTVTWVQLEHGSVILELAGPVAGEPFYEFDKARLEALDRAHSTGRLYIGIPRHGS